MARVLKSHEFGTRGGAAKYPWDEWMDGRIYEIKQGVDFDGKPAPFRAYLYQHAIRNGMKVRTEWNGNGRS